MINTQGALMRQIILVLLLLIPLFASCKLVNINSVITTGKVIALKNMLRTLYEKYSSEILSLRPSTDYQMTLKEQILRYIREVKKYLDEGNINQLEGRNLVAAIYYVVAFNYLNDIQSLINFFQVPTLSDYARMLRKLETFMRGNIFNLYLSGIYGGGCINETRVLYVKLRPLYEATKVKIIQIIENMPATFTQSLALKTIEIVHKASVLLTINYLNYLIHNLHDKLILNETSVCPSSYGLAPWLKYACAYTHKTLPPTPCNAVYSFVLKSVGLKEIANSLCGVKK